MLNAESLDKVPSDNGTTPSFNDAGSGNFQTNIQISQHLMGSTNSETKA